MRWPWFILLLAFLPLPILAAEPGEELTVYMVTMEPGDAVFEKFGHNVIRIRDAAAGTDIVYNWGIFDFDQERFFVRYLLGRMDYSMGPSSFEDNVNWYAYNNRTMWLQELDLTPAQRVKLRDFLLWHEQPQNATYRYNYYLDNCSTRVRDAIDVALDGQIQQQLHPLASGTTFRWHTRRLTRDSLFWYSVLNTVLGPKIDRPISQWEECFLPLKLRDHLRSVTARVEDGRPIPLVREERVIFTSTRAPEPTAAPNWIVPFFAAGAGIAALFAVLGYRAPRRRGARIGLAVSLTAYALLLGICSLLGLWFWLFSEHWAAWRNENLFGYSPLALPLVVLIPMLLYRSGRGSRAARAFALALAISTVLGVIAQALPWLNQVNGEPMALVLAPNVAMAWALWRFNRFVHPPTSPNHG